MASSGEEASATGFELEACLRLDNRKKIEVVAALPGGRIAAATQDTVRVWDKKLGEVLVLRHSNYVLCVTALSGDRVVTGTLGHDLHIWDLPTGSRLQVLLGHNSVLACVEALPEERIISGCGDGTLKIWDLTSGNYVHTLGGPFGPGHKDYVRCIAVLPGRAISASDDRSLILWNLADGSYVKTLNGHTDWIRCVVALRNGRQVVSGSDDATIRLWDVIGGTCIQTFAGPSDSWFTSLARLRDDRIVACSTDATAMVWNLANGCSLPLLEERTYDEIHGRCAALPDGRLALGSNDGKIEIMVDRQFEDERRLAKDLARQRLCADVSSVLLKFI